MRVRQGRVVEQSTWCRVDEILDRHGSDNGAVQLEDVIAGTVEAHLESDVDVGVFLSGGIDSSVIAAHATKAGRGTIASFSAGFADYNETAQDETRLAEEVATSVNTLHRSRVFTRDEFEAHLDHIFSSMDQPTIDGVNTYFVATQAHEAGVKVALSGIGGDEVFGGYPGFRRIPRSVRVVGRLPLRGRLGGAVRRASLPMIRRDASSKWASVYEYGGTWTGAYLLERGLFLPWEIEQMMSPVEAAAALEGLAAGWDSLERTLEPLPDRLKVSALELSGYARNQLLRDADWAGMANSVEVRVPFVDEYVVQCAANRIATGTGVSKQDLLSTAPEGLPPWLWTRKKTGFSVPTVRWSSELFGIEESARSWALHVLDRYLLECARVRPGVE
jgi:asparagine synthase (glutamine-hydrolysing)